MEQRFSTVRDTQRGLQTYMEKRKGKREIEVTRKRSGGIKRGESTLASNQFPLCSPHPGTPREVYRVSQRRGRKEIEVTRRRRGGAKRREREI